MSELVAFIQLGVRHIMTLDAMDHVLFLFVLAAIYKLSDWREVVRVVTAFTIGHSITLALTVAGLMPLGSSVVEFLIPVTIVAASIENIANRNRPASSAWRRYRPVFALVFGLVHGAGFGGYLKSLFVDSVAVPLLGFNIGIELGQIAVLGMTFAAIWVVDQFLYAVMSPRSGMTPVGIRAVGISATVLVFASRWAMERAGW